jgi:outer membrane receptor protein involved in Fe transport
LKVLFYTNISRLTSDLTLTRKGYVNGDLPTAGTAVVGVPRTERSERATINYGAQNLFGTTPYGGNIGTILASNRVGNNNLKFEKALKSEIGIEAAFFNNWLTMSSSVFQDVRKDFIYGDLTTVGTAFSTDINAGDWTSKGAELELKGFAIKNGKTSLSFYVNAA